jgi:hypothetical protein
MTRREKIIVAVMALVLIWGLYTLLYPAKPQDQTGVTRERLSQINKFVAEITKSLGAENTTALDTYVVTRAESDWLRKPFLEAAQTDMVAAPTPEEKRAEQTAQELATALVYSGYLEAGATRLAIINGLEYEIGEKLKQGEWTVKKIFPNRVEVGRPNNPDNIVVPLEELETFPGEATR